MSTPLFNAPVNVAICKSPGTIFSQGSSGGGSGGTAYTFVNLGAVGAGVLAAVVGNNVQFYRLLQGKNSTVTLGPNGIIIDTPDLVFNSTAPSTSPIQGLGGISLNGQTVLQALQALIYPIRPPVISLSIPESIYEYGDTSGLLVNWSVTKTDETILTISVDGQSILVTGNTQNGTVTATKSGTGDLVINMQVTTSTKTVNTSTTDKVARKIRVGYTTENITLSDSMINSALQNQFFYIPGQPIPTQSMNVGVNDYLAIEIPVSIDANWLFKINGFVNTAFNLVRANSNFVNSFGYSEPVNVWISQGFSTGLVLLDLIPL